ncbi:major facilitator superfamily domain-containing protein [Obelidium mucronatum]|nr:major facilitator superfamily domain-containing protein [Obelidium mucronatum]
MSSTTQSTSIHPASVIEEDPESTIHAFKRAAHRNKSFPSLFIALFVAVLLASIDISIGGPALNTISLELRDQVLLPWFGSAYNLAEGVLPILFGSLGDTIGPKWVLLLAFALFEMGSIVCGCATSMPMLIAGRALAGVGGSGIFPLVCVLIAKETDPESAAKYLGYVGAAFGLGAILGPTLGGLFTTYWSWRVCFLINIPIGIVIGWIILRAKPLSQDAISWNKLTSIDYAGVLLFLAFSLTFNIPLQFGGTKWPWLSLPVVSMFAVSALILVSFLAYELNMAQAPLLPKGILLNKKVLALAVISFCSSGVLYAFTYYSPLFMEIVLNLTPVISGVSLLAYSFVCIIVTIGLGRYDAFFLFGPLVVITFIVLLCAITEETPLALFILNLIIAGFGMGLILQLRFSALPSLVPEEIISTSTGFITAAMGLGGNVVLVITGTILNNIMTNLSKSSIQVQSSILFLQDSLGYTGDNSDYSYLINALKTAAANLTDEHQVNALLAGAAEVKDIFHVALRVSYYCLIPYLILIVLMTPIMWQKPGKRCAESGYFLQSS